MRVHLYCKNGANIHSGREETIDLINDWGYTEEDCENLSEEELQHIANEWAAEFLEISASVVE